MTKRPGIVDLALAGKLHLLEALALYPDFGPDARCSDRNADLFFSDDLAEQLEAKAICNKCPVVDKCLNWALGNEEFGVFGGATPLEREAMKAEIEVFPASMVLAWRSEKAVIEKSSVKSASIEFGVTERTVLRWRQVLDADRKAS